TTRIVELASAVLLAFYLPIAVGAPFGAHWIVVTLFSSRYAAAASVVPVLTAAALFYSIEVLGRMTAIALGHRREIAWITGLTLTAYVLAVEDVQMLRELVEHDDGGRAARVPRRRRRPAGAGTILVYHAVGSCASAEDPGNLFMPTHVFETQMGYLARNRTVV